MEETKAPLDMQTVNDSEIMRQSIINHVVKNALNSNFKSEQNDKLKFTHDEKRKITEDTFNDSYLKFLCLFGECLLEEHLEFFKSENIITSDINFEIIRLKHSKKVISRNRRYQAMHELLKGNYFNDNEMRNRDPLLWEQLVGQYLLEEETFKKEKQYVSKNSLTKVLFEQIDRDKRDDLKRQQQINETVESDKEKDGDDCDNDNKSNNPSMAMEVNKPSGLWGEYNKPKNQTVTIGKRRWKEDHFPDTETEQCSSAKKLSSNEMSLLSSEFRSLMIQKFLDGQDDFDYNNIDNNPEYDDLHTETIDEEDKYFDSESPREKSESQKVEEEVPNVELKNNSEEDELDVYMNTLIKNEITDSDADKFKK